MSTDATDRPRRWSWPARLRRGTWDVPAYGVSLVVHMAALMALALVGLASAPEGSREMAAELYEAATDLPEFGQVEVQEFSDEPLATTEAASTGPVLGALRVESLAAPSTRAEAAGGSKQAGPADLASVDIQRAADIVMPAAARFDQVVAIRGNGAEHVGDVEGAVDRIAIEISRRLEKGRTLVVWAFDASRSLQAEREGLAKHIGRVYEHIRELGGSEGRDRDGGLLTAVVAFGEHTKPLTPEPTDDPGQVVEAIRSVPADLTGTENTFTAVGEIIGRWGKYKDSKKHAYQTIVIVVTDEVGDDEARLEEAIGMAASAKVPVYVLGSPAVFGHAIGYMDYLDPVTKQQFRNLPVRQGPESAALEQIKLPFWYGGPQHDNLDAGFGPYALSRLAGATGGIYFVTRLGPGRVTFNPDGMREYRPEWGSRQQYESGVVKHPIRQAAMSAALITQQRLPGQPSLTFPPADDPDFKEAMAQNQELAARTMYTVDEALAPITAAARQRDRETSRRWQAHYDLARGRLLAMKVRCASYNAACAQMKKEPRKFAKEASNAWRLVPTQELDLGEKAKLAADEATTLLKRVETDHPGTPWALLAQRELRDPFGFRWEETYVPPRPRMDDQAAAKKRAMPKNAKAPDPPPPPKL
ncbi:VWA domain-containing protein [Isosphaeraceae bacterium EP7]